MGRYSRHHTPSFSSLEEGRHAWIVASKSPQRNILVFVRDIISTTLAVLRHVLYHVVHGIILRGVTYTASGKRGALAGAYP